MGEPGAPEQLQLNQPLDSYFKGKNFLRGIETPWGRERTGSISPVAPPWQAGQAIYETARGKSNPYDYSQETAFDYANPLFGVGVRFAQGEGPESLTSLAPNVRLAQDLLHPEASKYYPEDSSRLGRLKREVVIIPIDVNDFEESKKKTLQSDLSSLKADYRKAYKKPLPKAASDALERKYAVADAEDKLLGNHDKLTEAQKVAIRMNVAYDTVPSYRKYADEWAKAYQKALGDPLDFPHGEGDQPNGAMHTLRLYLEGKVLGYNYLNEITGALQDRREAQAANG